MYETTVFRLLTIVICSGRSQIPLVLKEISPEYSLEGLILKFQYLGHLMQRDNSLEKTLMLGKIEGRRRGRQRMRQLGGITNSNGHELEQALGDSKGQGSLARCSPWGRKKSDTTEQLNNNMDTGHVSHHVGKSRAQ